MVAVGPELATADLDPGELHWLTIVVWLSGCGEVKTEINLVDCGRGHTHTRHITLIHLDVNMDELSLVSNSLDDLETHFLT